MKTALRHILQRRRTVASQRPRLLFAFTGGSGAWAGMGCHLYRERAVFREAIDASAAVVEKLLGWSPVPLFRGAAPAGTTVELERRNEIIHLGILQLAQVDLWRAEGVTPAGVVAVSLGEMVAPYAAGALSREDCARVLAVVSQAISRTRSDEVMFILNENAVAAEGLCRSAPVPVHLLGAMSPQRTVALGRESDAAALRSYLGGSVIRELPTDWCYHTPRQDVDRAWMREQLSELRSMAPACPIYSAAAGGRVAHDMPFDAQFFSWMVSRPFRFADAVSAAFDEQFDAVLNLGPQPANNAYLVSIAESHASDLVLVDSMQAHDEEQAWNRARAELQSLTPRARAHPASTVTASTLHLADPATEARLFDVYEELRRDGSTQFLGRHRAWIMLSHEDVQRALTDPRFSSRVPSLQQADSVLLGNDPPDHTSIRFILSRQFSPCALSRWSALAEREAERLLQPLAEGGELDVVHFADALAQAVAADLVGFDRHCVASLGEPMLASSGESQHVYATLRDPLAAIAHRATIHAEMIRDAGGTLDEDAASSLVRLLWIASTTPSRAVSLAILLLLEHEEVRARLLDNPDLLGAFVDETLRLRPPAHMLPRVTTADVAAGGVTIPAGSAVLLCLAAANRDPVRFSDPALLRLDRGSNPHLSFGGGIHRCIGAPLARVQILAALRALLRRAPDFYAIQPLGTVRYAPGEPFRLLQQLVIGS